MVKVDGSMSVEFSKALSSPTEISTFIHVDDIRTISSSRAILQANWYCAGILMVLATKAVDEAIKKARRAFFAFSDMY